MSSDYVDVMHAFTRTHGASQYILNIHHLIGNKTQGSTFEQHVFMKNRENTKRAIKKILLLSVILVG